MEVTGILKTLQRANALEILSRALIRERTIELYCVIGMIFIFYCVCDDRYACLGMKKRLQKNISTENEVKMEMNGELFSSTSC